MLAAGSMRQRSRRRQACRPSRPKPVAVSPKSAKPSADPKPKATKKDSQVTADSEAATQPDRRRPGDAGRPELKRCLEYLREGDTLLVTKIDRLARSTSDLYRIVSTLAEKGVAFRVVDDPSIDTTSRTGKLVMGILALIAEFENDIRRERQMDGIAKAKERGVKFGRKALLLPETVTQIRSLRGYGATVPEIMRQTRLSKASVYRALNPNQRMSASEG